MAKTCEHNPSEGKRCRRRATHAVAYKTLFATQVGPNGDEPVYITKGTYRCADHLEVSGSHWTGTLAELAALNERKGPRTGGTE